MKKKCVVTFSLLAATWTCHVALAGVEFCAECKGLNKHGQWMQLQQFAPGRITLQTDPAGIRGTVTRIEVRPGDNVGGWGGERAERAAMLGRLIAPLTVNASTPKEYYGISVKLAPDWHGPDPDPVNGSWGLFMQLHGPDAYKAPPALALGVSDKFYLNMYSGDVSVANKQVIGYSLSDAAIAPGKWVDFVVEVVWSTSTNGSLAIYRRDEGAQTWKTIFNRQGLATLQHRGVEPVEGHYWKTGYYRNPSKSTSVLWLGPMVRATTRSEVETAAFSVNK